MYTWYNSIIMDEGMSWSASPDRKRVGTLTFFISKLLRNCEQKNASTFTQSYGIIINVQQGSAYTGCPQTSISIIYCHSRCFSNNSRHSECTNATKHPTTTILSRSSELQCTTENFFQINSTCWHNLHVYLIASCQNLHTSMQILYVERVGKFAHNIYNTCVWVVGSGLKCKNPTIHVHMHVHVHTCIL